MAQRVRKAVLPVAGLGTRFLPATKAMPKEMLTVVDRPLIQYAVEECLAAGIEEFVFVTGRNKSAIEDHFDHAYELETTLQQRGNKKAELKQTRGRRPSSRATRSSPASRSRSAWATPCGARATGSAASRSRCCCPTSSRSTRRPAPRSSWRRTSKTGGNVVAVVDVPREQTKSYGIAAIKAEKDGLAEITGLVEKPKPEEAPSTLALIGRYVLHARGVRPSRQARDRRRRRDPAHRRAWPR